MYTCQHEPPIGRRSESPVLAISDLTRPSFEVAQYVLGLSEGRPKIVSDLLGEEVRIG